MDSVPTPWQRMEEVIESSQLTLSGFVRHIGLKRSENLYQIKRGNNKISQALALRINSAYPQFSVEWLLTGNNPTHLDWEKRINVGIREIPVFMNPMTNKEFSVENSEYIIYISKRFAYGAEFGVVILDNSLSPIIPNNSVVFVRPFKGNVIYGKHYLVVTKNYTIIRRIRKERDTRTVRLEADNPHFDDMIIDTKDILRIYYLVSYVVDL